MNKLNKISTLVRRVISPFRVSFDRIPYLENSAAVPSTIQIEQRILFVHCNSKNKTRKAIKSDLILVECACSEVISCFDTFAAFAMFYYRYFNCSRCVYSYSLILCSNKIRARLKNVIVVKPLQLAL